MNQNEEYIDFFSTELHPLIKDIEEVFSFFILSHKVLVNLNVQNVLRQLNDPNDIKFLEKYNKWVDLKIKIHDDGTHTSEAQIQSSMIVLGKILSISLCETLRSSIYHSNIKNTDVFRIFYFLRNAAAHDNKFDLKYRSGKKKDEWMIGENEVLEISGKKIDRNSNGLAVFGGCFSVFDVFLLANDISKKMFEIDLQSKQS